MPVRAFMLFSPGNMVLDTPRVEGLLVFALKQQSAPAHTNHRREAPIAEEVYLANSA
jgi:hypothetical protein